MNTNNSVMALATTFADRGDWTVEQQFVLQMGSSYLLAHGIGTPLQRDAVTTVEVPADGEYNLLVRTKNWTKHWSDGPTPGIFQVLVDGVADTIRASHAQKFYICNIMTQDGETEGYTAADHLEALQRHGREGIVDLCLANNAPIPRGLAARYSEEDAELLRVDRERIAELGIALAEYPLLSAQGGYARHDPALLAQAVMELYRERTVRIYRGTQQYITEEQEWK